MPTPLTRDELITLFRGLGAHAPEEWVQYLPQDPSTDIARYMFLRQAWDVVPDDDDSKWIHEAIERSRKNPTEPYAGLGQALQRMLALGVSERDLTEVARCLQASMLFRIGYLLGGRAYPVKGQEHIDWALFRTNEDGEPLSERIAGLHESVLETDPTGREMRPREQPSADA